MQAKGLFNNSLILELLKNGVVEKKKRFFIDFARTIFVEGKLPTYFWAEVVNTTCFTHNFKLVNRHGKTPYEMINGKRQV